MQRPLQISFKGMERSEAVEARIREKVEKLERRAGRLQSCQVTVVAPSNHHAKGGIFEVHVEVRVPGHDLAVSRESGQDHGHEDAYVAIRDAFAAIERQMEHQLKRR